MGAENRVTSCDLLIFVDQPAEARARARQLEELMSPEQLAAHVTAWQDAGAVDGFTFMGSTHLGFDRPAGSHVGRG